MSQSVRGEMTFRSFPERDLNSDSNSFTTNQLAYLARRASEDQFSALEKLKTEPIRRRQNRRRRRRRRPLGRADVRKVEKCSKDVQKCDHLLNAPTGRNFGPRFEHLFDGWSRPGPGSGPKDLTAGPGEQTKRQMSHLVGGPELEPTNSRQSGGLADLAGPSIRGLSGPRAGPNKLAAPMAGEEFDWEGEAGSKCD